MQSFLQVFPFMDWLIHGRRSFPSKDLSSYHEHYICLVTCLVNYCANLFPIFPIWCKMQNRECTSVQNDALDMDEWRKKWTDRI